VNESEALEGTGRGRSPSSPFLAVPNVTTHPSTASVPITVLLYNAPLLCGFNVPVKGLIEESNIYLSASFMSKKHYIALYCYTPFVIMIVF